TAPARRSGCDRAALPRRRSADHRPHPRGRLSARLSDDRGSGDGRSAGGAAVNALHAIVGTAGHIDHGKTRLVRALTGYDTDRLKEEKERGISIDLGFAPLEVDGRRVGLVDVPGHER